MHHKAKSPQEYRVILQQDAPEPLIRAEVETVTPETLLEYSIHQFEELPIDVYGSDANHAGGVYYRSSVAERVLSAPPSFRSQQDIRMAERLQALFDAGTDPLQLYCEGAHAAGIDYMIQLRMNDLHDVVGIMVGIDEPNRRPTDIIGEPYYYTSGWKLNHPECLLGNPSDATQQNTYRYFERSALNYALGQVRAYILGMAEELITNYDLDIFEMDFIRFAFFFRRAEAYAQRHTMTQLVRRIRQMCDEVGEKRGRPVRLAARVPDTLELGLRAGIDTAEWLKQGMLDMVTISGGYTPFGTPWEQIVEVANKAGVPTIACLNHGNYAKDPNRIYAAAHRAYAAGVTGLKLWNFWYCFDYYHPQGENPLALEDFVKDIADPACLPDKALSFEVDHVQDPDEFVGSAHFHHGWPGQLPLTIGRAEDGIGQAVTFDIPEGAAARAPSHEAQLVLELQNFWAPEHKLDLLWNGQSLGQVAYELRPHEGAELYRVTSRIPCSSIHSGTNHLELRLSNHNPRVDPFIALLRAELLVPDKQGKLPPGNDNYATQLY